MIAYRRHTERVSPADASFVTQEDVLIRLCEGGHPYLCLVDLEKAFDSIEHSTLMENYSRWALMGNAGVSF